MKPREMTEIIDRKRYDTRTATVLAGNDYWDGHNHERSGRNTFLFRTPKGSYFAQHLTCWQDENDCLEPLAEDEAIELYEGLRERRVEFKDAFPNVTVEEA